jgi:hypothetical protein
MAMMMPIIMKVLATLVSEMNRRGETPVSNEASDDIPDNEQYPPSPEQHGPVWIIQLRARWAGPHSRGRYIKRFIQVGGQILHKDTRSFRRRVVKGAME